MAPAMTVEMPPDWQDALKHVLAGEARRVLVLGGPDAGKSTFCGMVLSGAVMAARRAALLDADPGQKQVGPPACVTLGYPDKDGTPVLSGLAYLGTVEPLRGWSRLIAGSAMLAAETRPDLVIVNTCGLLRGPGRRLKGAMISALRPDLLVAIGEDRDLRAVMADQSGIPALHLLRPALARRKGDGERRALRRAAFQAYFGPAPVWSLTLAGIRLASGDGETLPQTGRLVALADAAGHDMALGLVVSQDAPGRLLIRAPHPEQPVTGLHRSRLGLDPAWQEHRIA